LADIERSTVTDPPAGALPEDSVSVTCAGELGAARNNEAKTMAQIH
jgi:hypothetical protein